MFLFFLAFSFASACFDPFVCSFDDSDTCFNFGGSPPFTGAVFVSSPSGGIPAHSGNGMVLLEQFNVYYTAACLNSGNPMGVYCETIPAGSADNNPGGPFTRLGTGSFGAGSSPSAFPFAAPFQPYTISQWIYFDVNAAMQSTSNSIIGTQFNSCGGSRLAMSNAVYGARDFIFNFHFPRNDICSGANPNGCLYVKLSNNAAQPATELTPDATQVVCLSSNPVNAAERWYEMETTWSDNGSGVLQAEMTLRRFDGSVIATTISSDAADIISTLGGNNYLWFPFNSFDTSTVAVDSFEMTSNICPSE
jgi:hypothetical protein